MIRDSWRMNTSTTQGGGEGSLHAETIREGGGVVSSQSAKLRKQTLGCG